MRDYIVCNMQNHRTLTDYITFQFKYHIDSLFIHYNYIQQKNNLYYEKMHDNIKILFSLI